MIIGVASRLGWYVNLRLGSSKGRKRSDLLGGPGPVLGVLTSIKSLGSYSVQWWEQLPQWGDRSAEGE